MALMPADLEERFRWITLTLIVLFSLSLGAGLLLHMWRPGGRGSVLLLEAGLVLLMAAPATRLLLALAERIRRRDRAFVMMTVVIVCELALVMWRAAREIQ